MQLEMAFAEDGNGRRSTAGTAAAPVGVLSGRPWRAAPVPAAARVAELRKALPLSRSLADPLLAVLAARGLAPADLEEFFFPDLSTLPDPLQMREMETAARRLLRAAASGEKVAVHGDFDVDGLTGTAVLTELIDRLRVDGRGPRLVESFVPDRLQDGYGVAARKVAQWCADGVGLLVTVDTGVSAHEVIAQAARSGTDTIVLDHHLFDARPPAVAVVDPRRDDERYPNRDLCGAAVAFKLVQAVRRLAPDALAPDWEHEVLDLVALGLVADQMPLRGENRSLVSLGLQRLSRRESLRPGLAELLAVAGLGNGFPVTATQVAYQLAPRLNACGRVGEVDAALELLLTRERRRAAELARQTDEANRRRREIDREVFASADAQAERLAADRPRGLVLWGDGWHHGVIGISASRLVEKYGVPVILLSRDGEQARGSGRSVPGLDIKALLDDCRDELIRYGGHAQAAGMTVAADRLEPFRERFLAALDRCEPVAPPELVYDAELALDRLSAGEVADLTEQQASLEPFGEGHPQPLYRCRGLVLHGPPAVVGQDRSHLRFRFRATGGAAPALARSFISFGTASAWSDLVNRAGGLGPLLQRRWDVLFRLTPSTWRPRGGGPGDPVQQELVDLRPAAGGEA